MNVSDYVSSILCKLITPIPLVNHIVSPPRPDPATDNSHHVPPPPLNVPDISRPLEPVALATAPQDFNVDVQEDPLTSAPTTPDFRDAIDAFL